jgi:tRNA-5-taurinomethyluridine 2-sulfurtransferase
MKIAVLVSGGVDSSVALALLKKGGHDITALYLKIWLEDEMSYLGTCPWEEDLKYAEAVCKQLDVPLKVVPLQKEYHDRVVRYTIEAVEAGLTPNPDILCNREVKFGAFVQKYGDGYDYIATGHYARVTHKNNQLVLWQAPDPVKDQTYFLSMMQASQLQKALFPIGHLEKTSVRKLAQDLRLPTANRKDSQGICFLGQISFSDFIRHHLGVRPGRFVEKETGKDLGEHEGHYFYTIGQRRGVNVNNGPWYVCGKNAHSNIIYLTHGFSGKDQSSVDIVLSQINWISDVDRSLIAKIKLRHGPEFAQIADIHHSNEEMHVILMKGDRGITSGQYGVLYTQDNICVGAGIIA